jgi:hypothetical protein
MSCDHEDIRKCCKEQERWDIEEMLYWLIHPIAFNEYCYLEYRLRSISAYNNLKQYEDYFNISYTEDLGEVPMIPDIISEAWKSLRWLHVWSFHRNMTPVDNQSEHVHNKNTKAFLLRMRWGQLLDEIRQFKYNPPIKPEIEVDGLLIAGVSGYAFRKARQHYESFDFRTHKRVKINQELP